MNIVVISGSTRPESQSRKVADYLVKKLKELGAEAELVDLYKQQLPLYDDTNEGTWEPLWKPIEKVMEPSDGFVFVSPEWDGMFSVGIHNMIHYAINHGNVLANKPVMMASVSSGMGGVYPLEQMRATGPKNAHYIISSENLRVMNVEKVLIDGEFTEPSVRDRAEYSLKVLLEYAKALGQVRASGVIDFERFGNGV